MAAEYQILGAFPGACAGVDIAAQQPCGLPAHEVAAVGVLADGFVARGEVRNYRRAAQRKGNAGRFRSPEILAEFRSENEFRNFAALKQQPQPERDAFPEQRDVVLSLGRSGEMALFVEFVVVRQEFLGNHAQHVSVLYDDGAVVEFPAEAQRAAHCNEHVHACGVRGYLFESRERAVEKFLLEKQVLAGVAGNAEFRQHQNAHPLRVCPVDERGYLSAVVFTVGYLYVGSSGSDFYKSVLHCLSPLFILLSIIYYIRFWGKNQEITEQ